MTTNRPVCCAKCVMKPAFPAATKMPARCSQGAWQQSLVLLHKELASHVRGDFAGIGMDISNDSLDTLFGLVAPLVKDVETNVNNKCSGFDPVCFDKLR